MTKTPEPDIQARTVTGFCAAYGVRRSWVYELLKKGLLKSKKAGKRTLIDEASARSWYDSLPEGRK